jgi:hypothetical protein
MSMWDSCPGRSATRNPEIVETAKQQFSAALAGLIRIGLLALGLIYLPDFGLTEIWGAES